MPSIYSSVKELLVPDDPPVTLRQVPERLMAVRRPPGAAAGLHARRGAPRARAEGDGCG
ncbi:hypothetical protein HK405_009362, partial [Cladochytrium tenue]